MDRRILKETEEERMIRRIRELEIQQTRSTIGIVSLVLIVIVLIVWMIFGSRSVHGRGLKLQPNVKISGTSKLL
jgi:hypothetical protein